MCGIVGYVGKKQIHPVLLHALSRLEYRGYDSAGMATIQDGKVLLRKESGKLSRLQQLIESHPIEGQIGVGHTRWATHGAPTQRNAHPHVDCTGQIAIVHNGIIENHETLRKQLEREGHVFVSETDSEALAHLIESYHIYKGYDLEQATRLSLAILEGSYAFCVLSVKEQDRLVVARNGSPLVIGLGQGENFVASDAPAILDHTREMIFLEDYQMAVVNCNQVSITSRRGEPVQIPVTHIDWEAKDVSKDGFDHYMLKEIEEQPAIVDRILKTRLKGELGTNLFDTLRFELKEFEKLERVLIQACGTSWHAALAGKFLLEGIAGVPAEVDVSSEFRYRHLLPQSNTLVLSITQSGETIDTLMGLRRGKERGFKTLSIANVLGSTVARESDGVIYTHAGPEIGVASTKAYVAQLTTLFLLSLYLGRVRGFLSSHAFQSWADQLKEIPIKMKSIIDQKNLIRVVAEKYYEARDFLFLGRGILCPSAYEGALKIKEIAYIHATGHPAGEMKHGPIALIDEKVPIVALMPRSGTYEKMVSNIREVKARSGKVIAVVTEGNRFIRNFVDNVLYIPDTEEFLAPFLAALPLQYLAYFVAVLRGTDVDQPRNLAKSVTVE